MAETLPLASLTTFMAETGIKPCSSTSLPWTSSESMNSRKALVASSASFAHYMCSVAQILKESSVTFALLGSTPSTLTALNLESSKCEKSR